MEIRRWEWRCLAIKRIKQVFAWVPGFLDVQLVSLQSRHFHFEASEPSLR